MEPGGSSLQLTLKVIERKKPTPFCVWDAYLDKTDK